MRGVLAMLAVLSAALPASAQDSSGALSFESSLDEIVLDRIGFNERCAALLLLATTAETSSTSAILRNVLHAYRDDLHGDGRSPEEIEENIALFVSLYKATGAQSGGTDLIRRDRDFCMYRAGWRDRDR